MEKFKFLLSPVEYHITDFTPRRKLIVMWITPKINQDLKSFNVDENIVLEKMAEQLKQDFISWVKENDYYIK